MIGALYKAFSYADTVLGFETTYCDCSRRFDSKYVRQLKCKCNIFNVLWYSICSSNFDVFEDIWNLNTLWN